MSVLQDYYINQHIYIQIIFQAFITRLKFYNEPAYTNTSNSLAFWYSTYHTSIESIINHTLSPNIIDRVACAVSEDLYCSMNMLKELIQSKMEVLTS